MRSRASRQPSADVWAKIQLFPLITVIDTRSCHARAGYQRNQLFPHTFFCNLHRSYTTRWHALTSGSCGWFRMQQQLSCWQEVASPLPVSSHGSLPEPPRPFSSYLKRLPQLPFSAPVYHIPFFFFSTAGARFIAQARNHSGSPFF